MTKDEQKVASISSKKVAKPTRSKSRSRRLRRVLFSHATAIGRKQTKADVKRFWALVGSRGWNKEMFCIKLVEKCRPPYSPEKLATAKRQIQFVFSEKLPEDKKRKLNAPLAAECADTLGLTINEFDNKLQPRPLVPADIDRIIKYAPEELIGREDELKLLNDAWTKTQNHEPKRPHILTFVALGGEGKTSLVAKWAADLAHQNWPGCDAVFAWSFYRDGSGEKSAPSSDLFLKEALIFFGNDEDKQFAASNAGAYEKGQHLAHLLGRRRSLLILDGVEPLQYAPTSPTPGELKDQGVAALLKGLAAISHGLCVVTTRYVLPDLRAYWQTTAPMHELPRLSTAAGVKLLRTIGVKTGSQTDFEKLVEDVDGHALTLQVLGQFLGRAFHGDIRCRDRVKFEKADAKIQGGHAFRTMDAYAKWLENNSDEARRELALLKLLGLFDRPATAECVNALRQAPTISGLTEPLVGLAEDDWEFSLTSLRDTKLLIVKRAEGSGELIALDAHPLLREYFARSVREQQPEAWRVAHQRLYEYLRATTKEGDQPTLEDLQPLYQAVGHGCQAGMQQEAYSEVWSKRICRGKEYYSTKKLGVLGSDLGAITCFFEKPWHCISPILGKIDQAWLENDAAFCLTALGRLTEALIPLRVGLSIGVAQKAWVNASVCAGNLGDLELKLGEVARAVRDAKESVTYADRSGDIFQRMAKRTIYAGALHQAGRRDEAEACFREAEALQTERQHQGKLLTSVPGFKYCDLLLAVPERAAWQVMQNSGVRGQNPELAEVCRAVSKRAARTIKRSERNNWLLPIALDHLTVCRARLYEAILKSVSLDPCHASLQHAVDGLRRAGNATYLPCGLLTRAWLRSLTGARIGPESAQSDLDEAWEIAERGPMKLFMADIHLSRARLFFREKPYPWKSAQEGLVAAEKLIKTCGYHRRDQELADAKGVILAA
jgi:tetratricopeptide (TPR) repeat protein